MTLMGQVLIVLALVFGFVLGIKLPWYLILLIPAGFILLVRSKWVERQGMVGFIPVLYAVAVVIGTAIGILYYFVFFDHTDAMDKVRTGLQWLFTP